MFFSRKTLIVAGVVDTLLTLALMWGAYAWGDSKGYTNACEHSFFLASAVEGNINTDLVSTACELLKNRRDQAQELLDQAKALRSK